MEEIISLGNLPDEVLVKIMSYLETKEVLLARRVCSKFDEISKHPSLWKSIEVVLKSKEKLWSFSRFFSERPYLHSLFLNVKSFEFTSRENELINCLFEKSLFLECLRIECKEVADIRLPPNLRHLHCTMTLDESISSSESFNQCLLEQFNSLVGLAGLENLHLRFDEDNYEASPCVIEAGRSIFRTNEQTLKSLNISPLYAEWLPSLKKLQNLQQCFIPRFQFKSPEVLYEDFLGIVLLPHLQALALDYDTITLFSRVLENYELPNLNTLYLECCDDIPDKSFLNLILKKIPRLETFHIYACGVENLMDINDFIENCTTLKHINCDFLSYEGRHCIMDFIEKLFHLSEQRNFESICLCPTLMRMWITNWKMFHTPGKYISTFSCNKFHNEDPKIIKKSKCLCSFCGSLGNYTGYSKSQLLSDLVPPWDCGPCQCGSDSDSDQQGSGYDSSDYGFFIP